MVGNVPTRKAQRSRKAQRLEIFSSIALFLAALLVGWGAMVPEIGFAAASNTTASFEPRHLKDRIAQIDLGIEADSVITHPSQKIAYFLSRSEGKVVVLNFQDLENLTIEKIIDFGGVLFEFSIDSGGEYLYAVGNKGIGSILFESSDITKDLNNFFKKIFSDNGVIYQLNLDDFSVITTFFKDSFFDPTIAIDEGDRIYVGDGISSVIFSLSISQLFQVKTKLGDSGNFEFPQTNFADIDAKDSIFVGKTGVAQLRALRNRPWLVMSEANRQAISVYDTEVRRPVGSEITRLQGPGNPLAMHLSAEPVRLLVVGEGARAILLVYDLDASRDRFDLIATVPIEAMLEIGASLRAGKYPQASRSTMLLASDPASQLIAVGSALARKVIVFSRYENSLERINIIEYDTDVRDLSMSFDGDALVTILEGTTKIAVVEDIQTWTIETFAFSGTRPIREAQRVLATFFAQDPDNRPTLIDGYFGLETIRVAEEYGRLNDFDLPGDMKSSEGKAEAAEQIIAWSKLSVSPDRGSEISDPVRPESGQICDTDIFENYFLEYDYEGKPSFFNNIRSIEVVCDNVFGRFLVQVDVYEKNSTADAIEQTETRYATCSYVEKYFPNARLSNCPVDR